MQVPSFEFRGEAVTFVHRAIIRIVLADLLKGETGNMALQHLGILWIIYEYSDSNEPITTARLQELTNVHGTTIIKYAERLEQLGLVKRTRVTARHGKGRAWAYTPGLPQDLLSQTVKGILERALPFTDSDAIVQALQQPSGTQEEAIPAPQATARSHRKSRKSQVG
jgi:predicted transcriptional regulator